MNILLKTILVAGVLMIAVAVWSLAVPSHPAAVDTGPTTRDARRAWADAVARSRLQRGAGA